jgi:hypothetical protein
LYITSHGRLTHHLDSEIRLGAGYDPRVYYDFNGPPYFMLESAMATQLNICDHNKALIPPWKLYNAFRPGALIMAIVQVSTFGFTERSRVRKVLIDVFLYIAY